MMNTQELLQILACPACNVVYPVRDDIPIMLVDAAVERARWDEEHKG